MPLWSERLGKAQLSAIQVSQRRGDLQCDLQCELRGERVLLSGRGQTFMRGKITLALS